MAIYGERGLSPTCDMPNLPSQMGKMGHVALSDIWDNCSRKLSEAEGLLEDTPRDTGGAKTSAGRTGSSLKDSRQEVMGGAW